VDLDVFRPSSVHEARQRLGLPVRGTVVLGVASGWNDAKGLGDFNRLAERLFAGLNTPGVDSGLAAVSGPVSIVLVGGVGRRTSASQRINLVGVTHDVKQLADYYSAADVFLQLSSEETFGKVTAEALACGTPAVVYDSTANPELLGPGCGYVVNRGDLSQVVSRLRRIATRGKQFYAEHCRVLLRLISKGVSYRSTCDLLQRVVRNRSGLGAMKVYLFNILVLLAWAALLLWHRPDHVKKALFCAIATSQWIVVSGLRHPSVGADTYAYRDHFYRVLSTPWTDVMDSLWGTYFGFLA